MNTRPTVDLIVLNWNAGAYLDGCLRTLQAQTYPHTRITVVDNASSDDSVAQMRARFPHVRVVESGINRGYGGGNNVGLAHTDGEIAVMVNPDIEAPPDWLEHLVAPMVADPAIGVAGCLLCDPDGTIQHAGGIVHPPIGLTEHRGRGARDAEAYAAIADVDYVIGAAMAVRRTLVEQIGGFDELFFLYYEDVDLCFRAKAAGHRVVYVPTPPVVHHESVTTGKESQFYLEQLHAGRWRFLVKHTPASTLVTATVAGERAWTATRAPREHRALVRAYRQVLQELPRLWATRQIGEESMDPQNAGPELDNDQDAVATVAAQLAALAGDMEATQTAAMRSAMAALSQERQVAHARALQQLQRTAYVVEQPLTSQTPVIGPLLAWFRNTWNNIATTWYVRPLLQQQNDYNALVYAKLEELVEFQRETYTMMRETHALLAAMNERMIDDDRDVTALSRQVGKLQAALLQMERRLESTPTDADEHSA